MVIVEGKISLDIGSGYYDIVGTIVAGIGVIIIFYYPRKEGEKIRINTSE